MLFLLYLNTHFVFQDLFGIVLNTTLAYHLNHTQAFFVLLGANGTRNDQQADQQKGRPEKIQTAQAKHVKPCVIPFLREPTNNASMKLFRLVLRPFGSPADYFPCVMLPTLCSSLSFPRCYL